MTVPFWLLPLKGRKERKKGGREGDAHHLERPQPASFCSSRRLEVSGAAKAGQPADRELIQIPKKRAGRSGAAGAPQRAFPIHWQCLDPPPNSSFLPFGCVGCRRSTTCVLLAGWTTNEWGIPLPSPPQTAALGMLASWTMGGEST